MSPTPNNRQAISLEEAEQYYQNDPAHNFDHVLRVLATAQHLAEAYPDVDLAVLSTATLLHDIARADQARTGVEHSAEGARRAREILADYPADFVEAVCHAIASHRFRVDRVPQTLEAKLLYDADKLDSIGAIGVARAFIYAGHHNGKIWAEDESGLHTPVQEYRQKLQHVKGKLLTEVAKKLAESRHQIMLDFFDQLEAEVKGLR